MDLPLALSLAPAVGWALHGSVLSRRLAHARRDPLTGLHTRDGWTARAERTIHRHPNALVVLVDLDDFKQINDTHGHAAGDTVISAAGARLALWCARHGIAARIGGDEFALVVTDPARTPGLPALTTALHRPVQHGAACIPMAASVGSCRVADLPTRTLTDALATADAAMYAAKGHGRRNNRSSS